MTGKKRKQLDLSVADTMILYSVWSGVVLTERNSGLYIYPDKSFRVVLLAQGSYQRCGS